jgi:cell wall-associated NlpC family hydrolase
MGMRNSVRAGVVTRSIAAGTLTAAIVLAAVLAGSLALLGSGISNAADVCVWPDSSGDVAAGRSSSIGREALTIPGPNGAPMTLNVRQQETALAYISVGRSLKVPGQAIQIAIMMALQESGLRMLANPSVPESLGFPNDGLGYDHDSIGSAQQRPGAGWGRVQDLMRAEYNAAAFFGGANGPNRGSPRGLLDIVGWERMSLGEAAQAVQVSAFPERYARWEPAAAAIIAALAGDITVPRCESPAQKGGRTAPAIPGGLDDQRRAIIGFAQQGLGGRYVWGGTAFKAWDCSGYVMWIYAQIGRQLPRVDQWVVGAPTSTPLPGDLVVQNPDGPEHWGHVGIYAGDGMMYSALNPSAGTLLHPIEWNPGSRYFTLLG